MVQIHYWFQDEIKNSFNNSSGTVSVAVQKVFRRRFKTCFSVISGTVSSTDPIIGFKDGFRNSVSKKGFQKV